MRGALRYVRIVARSIVVRADKMKVLAQTTREFSVILGGSRSAPVGEAIEIADDNARRCAQKPGVRIESI